MEKQSPEGKSRNSERNESGTRGVGARLPEPPKFYSKSYLKRYNHGKVRGPAATASTTATGALQQQQQQTSQAPGKKSSQPDDQPGAATRSQKDGAQNDNAADVTITMPRAADGETVTTSASPETSKTVVRPSNPRGRTRQERSRLPEQDWRYSLVNAMSSVRSSYFKSAANAQADLADEGNSGPRVSLDCEDEQFCEWFRKVKSRVDEAVKRHKVFLIRGELPRLKEALEERGWIQKYESSRTRLLPYECAAGMESKSLGDLRHPDGTPNERALVFALLRHVQPDFIWDCRNDFVEWDRSIAAGVLLNRFQKPGLYTSKLGMAHVLQEAHWLHETNVADVLFPRSYNPSRELGALSRDFKRCAALALVRKFVDRVKRDRDCPAEKQYDESESAICLDRIEFAIRCCEEQIAELENEDIDGENDGEASDDEWRLFFEDCERLLYKPGGLANLPKAEPERLEACLSSGQYVLEKLKALDPQFDLNGECNIWIVKPSNLCCGSGIFMTHDLKTIFRKVESKPRDYYVVQKYIERPFLVYGTKFDIRQWFLVTSTFPMTIWMFKEPLLRFSSRPYSHATYHEAVHLCNTAVQERYDYERRRRRRNAGPSNPANDEEPTVRDQAWDCHKLNDYLKNEGQGGEPYWDKIYPKMSQAIVLTMLAAQDFMDRRRCSFELYGADFMVMEDLSVWLIEINTNPRMHPPSSRITQRLYGEVLDSLVKVVMDLPLNPNADTGGFELAYRQSQPDNQPYLGPCFFLFGKSMPLHEPSSTLLTSPKRKCPGGAFNGQQFPIKQYRAWTAPPALREPKVVDFVACLNTATGPRFSDETTGQH